ncbi:hypothetical protein A4H97_15300 [Niastella yeongjuensis]|uniref:Beta-lactamase-inhibitor-like PepSY-like domain-containing protein n=1 Tax=Niastella yeongjuensis TaxID=354355 RepID=A0A1V9E4D5_9BACT|nr:hypothetical protein [Niastella yeongjuensis]OQP40968.1 hypothetical protein A4H97_15300 [Niastella yeongjuensis]SEO96331.1 hypothetical protein SAMN05660816_03990 [Niastella yeongjuensis]
MKKNALVLFLVLMYQFSIAQDDIVITGTNKISKELTPKQIIDSLEARFPDAKSVAYFKVPKDAAARGWAINVEDNIEGEADLDYYALKFKRADFQYYGLYKPDGTLVMSKYQETVQNIPDKIKESLTHLKDKYPGYKLSSKTYYKNTNYNSSKEYYEFVASNGKEKKKVIYDGEGELVKVK